MLCIAEAGVNHNGNLDTALALVDAAVYAEADAVKFQLFDAARLKRPELAELQLSGDAMRILMDHAGDCGIEFMATPFDPRSLSWLVKSGVARIKLASSALFNPALLRAANGCGKPVILSTGMGTLEDVERALLALRNVESITLLHCVSAYPAPVNELNLRAMRALSLAFCCPVGYSDHSANPDALVAASALGACCLEAHLTLDCTQPGPDHRASYEPERLRKAFNRARNVQQMLGEGGKHPQTCELRLREALTA